MTDKKFGERLKELRIQKNLTQSELAEKAGLTLRSIQRLEKGENKPRPFTLKQLCFALETSEQEFYYPEFKNNPVLLILMLLSACLFFIKPILAPLFPLALWLMKRNEIKGMEELGRNFVNFQLSWVLIYYSISLFIIGLVFNKIDRTGHISALNLVDEIIVVNILQIILKSLNLLIVAVLSLRIFNEQSSILPAIPFINKKKRPWYFGLFLLLIPIWFYNFNSAKTNQIQFSKNEVQDFCRNFMSAPIDRTNHNYHPWHDTIAKYAHPSLDSSAIKSIRSQHYIPFGKLDQSDINFSKYKRDQTYETIKHFIRCQVQGNDFIITLAELGSDLKVLLFILVEEPQNSQPNGFYMGYTLEKVNGSWEWIANLKTGKAIRHQERAEGIQTKNPLKLLRWKKQVKELSQF